MTSKWSIIIDEFVGGRIFLFYVIPVSVFTGVTGFMTFYGIVNFYLTRTR